MKKKYIKIIIFVILLVFFDQLTKILVVNNFNVNESLILINNFLNFTYITNTGAAFGMLNGNTIILGIFSILLILYLIKEVKNNMNNKIQLFSLSLVISGAFGNLIDRFFRNYVVDFISFKLFSYQMPIFNLADVFITIGIILLITCVIRGEKNDY